MWRRIEVRSDVALDEFSGLLEAAMGWWGHHLHSFEADGAVYERPYPDDWLGRETHDESEHRLGDVLGGVGAKMCWDYDFGDGWQHDIEVEAIEAADPGATYRSATGCEGTQNALRRSSGCEQGDSRTLPVVVMPRIGAALCFRLRAALLGSQRCRRGGGTPLDRW